MNVIGRLHVGGALCVATAQILLVAPAAVVAQPQMGTAFTYQGKLTLAGVPIEGTDCCFDVSLWDAAVNGTLLGTWGICGPDVSEGLFTLPVDFGPDVFDGTARWLEIAVCCQPPDDCSLLANYTTLTPRQKVTPAPHALALPGLWTQQNSTSPNLIGGFSGNTVTSTAVGATIGGGGHSADINRVTDEYGTVAGGSSNQAGNGDTDTTNATHTTVGGGQSNTASGGFSTIGGGFNNDAGGGSSTIGGGVAHSAGGLTATVGGGGGNDASGAVATIAGGGSNVASGDFSTVPGGNGNAAGGEFSMAAGRRAKVRDATQSGDADGDEGTFVWADSTPADFTSTGPDQFLIRANGGVGIGTTAPQDQVHLKSDASNRLLVETTAIAPFHFAGVKAVTPTMDYFFGACQNCLTGAGTHWEVFDNLANATRLRIDSQGKVGIATTDPQTQLEVVTPNTNGVVWASTLRNPRNAVTSGYGVGVKLKLSNYGPLELNKWAGIAAVESANFGDNTNLTFYTTQNADGGNAPTEKLRIASSGNVGIGTTNPTEKLQVNGRVHSTSGGFRFPDGTIQTTAAGAGGPGNTLDQAYDQGGAGAGRTITADAGAVTLNGSPASTLLIVNGAIGGQSAFFVDTSPSRLLQVVNNGTGDGVDVIVGDGEAARLENSPTFDSSQPTLFARNMAFGKAATFNCASGANLSDAVSVFHAAAGATALSVNGANGAGQAARFVGSVDVQGAFTAISKSFRIDHPLDPRNKYLSHSCVESSEMKNVYDGVIELDGRGEAWVELSDWFEALNRDFRYQLTAIGAPAPNLYVAREMSDNRFKIAGGKPGMKVSWQATGVRQDAYAKAHRIRVEELKPPGQRGRYLYPEAYTHAEQAGAGSTEDNEAMHAHRDTQHTAPTHKEGKR